MISSKRITFVPIPRLHLHQISKDTINCMWVTSKIYSKLQSVEFYGLHSDDFPRPILCGFLSSSSWQQCSWKGEEVEGWLTGSTREGFGVSRVMEVPNYFPGCMERRRSWPKPFSAECAMRCILPLGWTDSAPKPEVKKKRSLKCSSLDSWFS